MKKPIQKKNFISLDVTINAINVIIFFDSFERNHDCWALVLGQTRVFTDP